MGIISALWRVDRKRATPQSLREEWATPDGLRGQRPCRRERQLTILTREGWEAASAELGKPLDPIARRANVLVEGLDLGETTGRVLRLGPRVRLLIHGETKPCARMDEACPGLRRALEPEWRGGVHGEILAEGWLRVGDELFFEEGS